MKATKKVLIYLERGDPFVCFEYRTSWEQWKVAEILTKLLGIQNYSKTIFEAKGSHENKRKPIHDFSRSKVLL